MFSFFGLFIAVQRRIPRSNLIIIKLIPCNLYIMISLYIDFSFILFIIETSELKIGKRLMSNTNIRKSTETKSIFAQNGDSRTRAPMSLKEDLSGKSFLGRSKVKQLLFKIDVFGIIGKFIDLKPGTINGDARLQLLTRICTIFELDADTSKEGMERVDFKAIDVIKDSTERDLVKAYISVLFDDNRDSSQPISLQEVAAKYNKSKIEEILYDKDMPIEVLVTKWSVGLRESSEWGDDILNGRILLPNPKKTHAQYQLALKNQEQLENWFDAEPEKTDSRKSFFFSLSQDAQSDIIKGRTAINISKIQKNFDIYCNRRSNEAHIAAFRKEQGMSKQEFAVMLKFNGDRNAIADIYSGQHAISANELNTFYNAYQEALSSEEVMLTQWLEGRGVTAVPGQEKLFLELLSLSNFNKKITLTETFLNDQLRTLYVLEKGVNAMSDIVDELSEELKGNEKRLSLSEYTKKLHTKLLVDLGITSGSTEGSSVKKDKKTTKHETCQSSNVSGKELKRLPLHHYYSYLLSTMILEPKRENQLFVDKDVVNGSGRTIVMPQIGYKDISRGENITVINQEERKNFYGTGKKEVKDVSNGEWVLDTWTTDDKESDFVSINTATKQAGYSTDDQIVEHTEILKKYLGEHGVESEKIDNLVWLLQGLISQNFTTSMDESNLAGGFIWKTDEGRVIQMAGAGRKTNYTLDLTDPKNPKFTFCMFWEKGSLDQVLLNEMDSSGQGLCNALSVNKDETELYYEIDFNINLDKVEDKYALIEGAVTVDDVRYDCNIVEKKN